MPIIRGEITETVDISTNGTHNVARYTSANVNVQPSISSLNVTPTTSSQTITAPLGTDGYSPVNVSAVTSSIDANITAGNIKKGVTILGVTGSYEGGGGSATQHGVNLKGWCGDVGSNGQIRTDQAVGTLSIPGLTYIGEHFFMYKFKGSTGLVGTVNLPDVVDISDFGMYEAFANTNITGVNLDNLGNISGSGLGGAFKGTQITTITINCGQVFGQESFNNMCENCTQLQNVYLNIPASLFTDYADGIGLGVTDVFDYCFYKMISGCTNCTVHLIQDIWQDWNQWYTDKGETPPYSTASDWATGILTSFGGGTGNSVVFDINPS